MTPSASSPAPSATSRAATPRRVASSDPPRRPAGSTRPSESCAGSADPIPGAWRLAIALSLLYASRGDFVLAVEPLQAESARDRPDVRVLEQLASVAADAADESALAAAVRRLGAAAPGGAATLYYTATLHAIGGRLDESLRFAEALNRSGGCHARCQNLLGALYDAVGRKADARRAFLAAIAADSRDATAYTNLATFELRAGSAAAARALFAEALVLDPNSPAARQGLAQAIRQCEVRVLGAGRAGRC